MLIDIRDITKVYEMGLQKVRALARYRLELDPRRVRRVMGPSGSGKSP